MRTPCIATAAGRQAEARSFGVAALITHLVVGERVFARVERSEWTLDSYGEFLLGCVLPDESSFSEGIGRRRTHFASGLHSHSEETFRGTCTNFTSRLDTVLVHPWPELGAGERAFVAGYLCHLAADEVWRELCWGALQMLRIGSWTGLSVPGDVILTASSVLSNALFTDCDEVVTALRESTIPHALSHVPHSDFERMWHIVREHLLDGGTVRSYLRWLERQGRPQAQVRAIRQQHTEYWDGAMAFVEHAGGMAAYVDEAIGRAVSVLPELWEDTEHSNH